MCGIAGIIGRLNDVNRAALGRMECALSHRGPDSTGLWTGQPDADGFGCMLAHRRLSILDLSHAADQPMVDPVTGQVIVFNGEIYNFKSLRADLETAGQTFQSSGDTAVMLRALGLHGQDAVKRLRGMFAFALWDDRERRLVLARDPLGIKPLYVCRNPDPSGDWSLLFASEVRGILASGLIGKPRLDPVAMASVVWNGFVVSPNTIVQGIETLWPGEVRVLDGRGRERSRETYWRMPSGASDKRLDEVGMRDVLEESVRLHMVSDVPIGVFLSSGVDSSAVANLAQRCTDHPINTFTLAFEERQLNEGDVARQIAQAIGSHHREVVLTEQAFVADLDRALDTLDQPTFDGLNSFYMSKAVREAGLTVALVGTGGDELFGGYSSFRDLPRLQRAHERFNWIPSRARRAGAKLVAAIKSGRGGAVAPQTRWAKLPDMVDRADDRVALYQLAYGLFLPDFHRELLAGAAATTNGHLPMGLSQAMLQRLREEIAGHSPLSAVSVMETRCFLGERLLRDSDAASMAVSLELRLPLVDQVVVEQATRLPDDLRYAPVGRKALLRRIGLAGLDPALFDRPKRGFVLPFDLWIRKNLGRAMDAVMSDPSASRAVGLNGPVVARLWQAFQAGAPGLYWSRVWAIYVLIRWCQRNGVSV